MKRFFTLLVISLFVVFEGFSQNYVNYDRDSRWFIGINGGATWTTRTEVPFRLRGGYGLTFGKSFGMEEGKIFSWDIRARFLKARIQGQETGLYNLDSTTNVGLDGYGTNTISTYQDTLGYFIPNYLTNVTRGSIELVLNTNRLRERRGINLYAFGGIGITGYHTAADLLTNDEIYDYPNGVNSSKGSLLDFQDGDYETDINGESDDLEIDWMPSFGFGISKQIHPAVALGLEHKMTWTRTNDFDGLVNNLNGTPDNQNDIYHYTSATLKFHLFNGKRETTKTREEPDVDDFDTADDPVVINDPISRKKPIVDIYDPNVSPYKTTTNTFKILANVYYVDNKSNVTFKQDGNINTNFSFNPTSNKFESNVVLHPGQNLFEITGINEAGSDYESVIIIYEKEEEPLNPPIVTITNPPYTPYYTNSNIFELISTVLNVDSKSQIHVYLNGVNLPVFSYNLSSKVLNTSLNLQEGKNTVVITATNAVGSDSKTVEIIYEKPEILQPPVVNFINPSVDPYYTNVSSINIKATVLNVDKKSDINVRVNGNVIGGFAFNSSTKEISFLQGLIEGANIVEITGTNTAGSDFEATTIVYTRPETPKPPIVTFIDPAVDPITIYTSSYNVTAKVQNVDGPANITLRINGVVSTLFSYSNSSELMNFTTSLYEGSNVIEIKGTNKFGSDIETTTIIYKKTITQAPPIVDITYPGIDNQVFTLPNITLEASVLNVNSSSNINVRVNGVNTTSFTYNTFTKELDLPMVLANGANIVEITGTNLAGVDKDTRIIIYEQPTLPCPPTVNFINPPTSPYSVTTEAYTVTANTTNISSKSQIVFKQNGNLISSSSYSFVAGHQIVYNATLIPGNNIFQVTVTNSDGTDSDLAIVNYVIEHEPCVVPSISMLTPNAFSTLEDENVTITAKINDYSSETLIELRLNGESKGYMSYNASTSIASKAIVLSEGSNAITIIATNDCGKDEISYTLTYDVPDAPCIHPTLTALGSTTFETLEEKVSLSLIATHVANSSELNVKVNGGDIPFVFDTGTGTVTIDDALLSVGLNAIVVTAITECGTANVVFTIVREVCEIPSVSGLNPANGTTVTEESVVFTASVSHVSEEEITLIVNGAAQAFSYNTETNTLSEAINLIVGNNNIQIIATNACGTDSKTITLERAIPCHPIVTNLLSPTTNNVTATEESYDISLNTSGITSVSQIAATINGTTIAATFDAVSGNISLSGLSLIDGINNVTVTLTNECSEVVVNYAIEYHGCEPPVVIINGISPGMTVTDGIFNLNVVITNVTDAADITVKVNGENVDFDFNPMTHLLTAEFPLLQGNNNVEVIAAGCELVSEAGSLEYEEPCEIITHALISPTTTTGITAVESDYAIALSVGGIESSDQVTVTQNGSAIPFNYNNTSKIITINGITLADDLNNVLVKLTNDCSSETINYAITYDGCEPPVITFGSNAAVVNESLYTFEANVSNISSASDIMVMVNGVPVPFTFDLGTGNIEATFDFPSPPGNNTITIIANGCEEVEKSFEVNYIIPCKPLTYTLGHPENLTAEVAESVYSINLIAQEVLTAGIFVSHNGNAIPFTYSDNLLSINSITLVDGLNTIIVELSNGCSNESITYLIEHSNCSTPEIDLSANGLSTEMSSYSFVASVTEIENKSELSLQLNGASIDFTFSSGTGSVTALLTLVEGENTIQLIANGCDTASANISVDYTIHCEPITYTLGTPTALVSETTDDKVTININTSHVPSESSITATLNGATVAHNLIGGVVALNDLALEEGTNIITITLENDCSSETITFTIERKLCPPPSITINGLADGIVLTDEGLIFFATILNVEDAGDIILKLNGVAVPFEYSTVSKVLQAPLTITDGSNTIEVIVDGCSPATADVDVVYEEPCASPTFTLVNPTEFEVTAEGEVYVVVIATEHVTEDQVSVKIDGIDVPFAFTDGTVVFDVTFSPTYLSDVLVTLENECDTTTIDYSIILLPESSEDPACASIVSANFSEDNKSVVATSDKDLSNVVLKFEDSKTQKFDDLSDLTGTFSGTGTNAGKCIVGVWIKSGCNQSGDGPGYGAYVENASWDGICEDKAACQPITYSLIAPNRLDVSTTVTPFNIVINTAHIKDKSGIVAKVNNVTKDVVFAKDKITLSGFGLNPGVNTIVFTLSNDCSTKTITYHITLNSSRVTNGLGNGTTSGGLGNGGTISNGSSGGGQIQTAPVVKPVSPRATSIEVKTQTFALKTQVLNVTGKSQVELILNGNKIPGYTYNSASKQISAVVRLNSGLNTIVVRANNGKQAELKYRVTYVKSSQGLNNNSGSIGASTTTLTPRLTRVAPSSQNYTTKSATYTLKVKALNIKSKSDITLLVNGTRVTNFAFNSSTKLITSVLRLKAGTNSIRISAKNGAKKTDLSYTITSKPAVNSGNSTGQINSDGGSTQVTAKKPQFRFVSPTSTIKTVRSQNFVLKTKILNVSKKSDIQLSLNGARITAFTFNPSTHELIATLRLKTGKNTVKVNAKNGTQSANTTYSITYQAALPNVGGGIKTHSNGRIKTNGTGTTTNPSGIKQGTTTSGSTRRGSGL